MVRSTDGGGEGVSDFQPITDAIMTAYYDRIRPDRTRITQNIKRIYRELGFERKICLWCLEPIDPSDRKRYTFCCTDHFHKWYGRYEWTWLSSRILTEHRDCEVCGVVISQVVHHQTPYAEGGSFFDPENLIAVCEECHWKLHRQYNRAKREMKTTQLLHEYWKHQEVLPGYQKPMKGLPLGEIVLIEREV